MSLQRVSLGFCVIFFLEACSGGGSNSGTTESRQQTNFSENIVARAGEITHYGAVTISDEVGMASDLLGSFFRLSSAVSADFMQTMLSGEVTQCQVQDDGLIYFEEISVGFIPQVPGISKTAVSAGNSIIFSNADGAYATLDEQPAAGFLFYDLPDGAMLIEGSIPTGLTLNVPGSNEISSFNDVPVPLVSLLVGTDYGAAMVTASTAFTWTPSDYPNALIRIYTSTAGGFFLEDGVTVTCVTPDTGSFTYPTSIQMLLGTDFRGEAPIMSRFVANTVQADNTVLYVIRESFSQEN